MYSENGGAQLDPYRFTHQLLDASIEYGLRIYENTEVTNINYSECYVEAETRYVFKVKGKIIIAATGYNTKLFTKRNFGVKTTTFNVATKILNNIEKEYPLIRDNKNPYNYFRTTSDKRIIGGGEDISFIPGIFNEKLAEEKYSILESNIKRMFKNIENIEIEYKYCRTFASTQDNLGFIGKDPDNDRLWYNLEYGADGILFAILGGMMLSELYEGKESKYLELFKVDRFDN